MDLLRNYERKKEDLFEKTMQIAEEVERIEEELNSNPLFVRFFALIDRFWTPFFAHFLHQKLNHQMHLRRRQALRRRI